MSTASIGQDTRYMRMEEVPSPDDYKFSSLEDGIGNGTGSSSSSNRSSTCGTSFVCNDPSDDDNPQERPAGCRCCTLDETADIRFVVGWMLAIHWSTLSHHDLWLDLRLASLVLCLFYATQGERGKSGMGNCGARLHHPAPGPKFLAGGFLQNGILRIASAVGCQLI